MAAVGLPVFATALHSGASIELARTMLTTIASFMGIGALVLIPVAADVTGRVSVFAVVATWKDYLWPLLVIRDPDLQPLSVRLPTLQPTTDLGVLIAALTISSIFPVAAFLIFQRLFLNGAGLSGAIKG